MKWRRYRNGIAFICGALLSVGTLACSGTDSDDNPEPTETTGVQMTIDIQEDTNIDGIRFSFFECGEHDPWLVEDQTLDEMKLPEGMPQFGNDPFDEDSEHLYANHVQAVDPGCYDVTVEPIDGDGDPVAECQESAVTDVDVQEDETVELLLVSQCDPPEDSDSSGHSDKPDKEGVIDATGAVNHPPVIQNVKVDPSTTLTCPAEVEMCATVTEPDADPVVFDWDQLEGPQPVGGPTETFFEQDGTHVEKCIAYEFADETADYLFEITVWDYFMEGEDDPIVAEIWYEQEGFGDIESRDQITVPISVECPEDVLDEIEEKDKDDKKEKKDDKKDEKDKKVYDDKDKKEKKDDKKDEEDKENKKADEKDEEKKDEEDKEDKKADEKDEEKKDEDKEEKKADEKDEDKEDKKADEKDEDKKADDEYRG